MFVLVLAEVIQAEREREMEEAMRRRRLLRPQDGPTESTGTPGGRTSVARALRTRARLTEG